MAELSIATDSPLSITAEERGQRLRQIRESLKMSRLAFGEHYDISPRSIQNWESARYGGLTEKGARKIICGLQKDGIDCTLEWLFLGFGYGPPGLVIDSGVKLSEYDPNKATNSVGRELSYFHQLNPGSVDMIMPDDSMEPAFFKGDCVAGRRFIGGELQIAHNKSCIVQLQDGKTIIRKLLPGDQSETFHLTSYNTKAGQPELKNVRIFSAAPIVWLRRKIS
jgi:DNA-binding transcriptional regulator YiaG